eukprot:2277839-Rhodomonas_salina.2
MQPVPDMSKRARAVGGGRTSVARGAGVHMPKSATWNQHSRGLRTRQRKRTKGALHSGTVEDDRHSGDVSTGQLQSGSADDD